MKEDYGFFEKYWIICIAVIIACINIGCRINDGIANQNYEIVDGMVTSITSETATIETGGYYAGRYHTHQNGKVYYAEIEYRPHDSYWDKHFRVKCGIRNYAIGDTVTVMYNPDNIYDERYLAKKDWITGKWLDLEKNYNSPLIIAVMFLLVGIAYLYLIGVKKAHFKNSWMLFSISVLVFGLILVAFCNKLMNEGGEIADEALMGFFAGIILVLFSSVFIAKKLRGIRKKEATKPDESKE